jgi:hypothetical protein
MIPFEFFIAAHYVDQLPDCQSRPDNLAGAGKNRSPSFSV